jgi:hypothetical protein
VLLELSTIALIATVAEDVFEERVVVMGANYLSNEGMTSIDPELGYHAYLPTYSYPPEVNELANQRVSILEIHISI